MKINRSIQANWLNFTVRIVSLVFLGYGGTVSALTPAEI